MSEETFKVQAKKPPSTRPTQKTDSKSKLEAARVQKTGAQSKTKEALPQVHDLGSMKRDERIAAVLAKEGVKATVRKGQSAGKKQTGTQKAGRYDGMKRQIASQKKSGTKAPASKGKAPSRPRAKVKVRPDNGVLVMRLCLVALVIVLSAITAILVLRRVEEGGAPTAALQNVAALEGTVTIESGMGAGAVASLFAPYTDSGALLDLILDEGLASSIRSGSYSVHPGMDPGEVVEMIAIQPSDGRIHIYPGYTIDDVDQLLSSRGLAQRGDFSKACDALSRQAGLDFAEGWLLAGDYVFTDPDTLARDMLSATLSLFKAHAHELALSPLSMEGLVIVASMVNRETQDEAQMPVIAAVILNRLEADMPLGIDATTRYELDDWTSVLPQSVFEELTAYNTRRRKGLPPSGIGCPGQAAILACLAPSDSQALYYFHDEEGGLHTSMSYEEHLASLEALR